MSTFSSVSDLLNELALNVPGEPKWSDVLSRADALATAAEQTVGARPATTRQDQKHHWIRVGLVAAAALAIAAPAVAFRHEVVEFFTAPHASRSVVDDFGRLQVSSFPSSAPGVIPGRARTVTSVRSGGVTATLSVAPTRRGTYCDLWRLHGDAPITGTGVECLATRKRSPLGTFSYSSLTPQLGIDTLIGSVLRDNVAVRVNYKNGTSSEIDYTWVTDPIRAGFFYYTVPAGHNAGSARPVSLTVSANGHVLASEAIADPAAMYQMVNHVDRWGQQIQTSPEAVWEKRRLLQTFNEKNGTLVELWVMPSRHGTSRRCFVANPIANGCIPAVLSGDPLQLEIIPGRTTGTALLFGEVSPRVRRVKLVFSDGRIQLLVPRAGFLLAALPARSYPRGHRLHSATGADANGRFLFRQLFRTDVRDTYPCAKPKNYGYGVAMCP